MNVSKTTAIILSLAAFIFGSLALSELSVDLLPNVDSPNLVVRINGRMS